MRRIIRAAVLCCSVVGVFALATTSAFAHPAYPNQCTGCHSGVNVAITPTLVSTVGTVATYNVSAPGATAIAIFDGTTKLSYVVAASGQFVVTTGKTYKIIAVKGPTDTTGVGSVNISPVAAAPDTTAPVTTSNAVATYVVSAVIKLTPTDVGGSGVANTYYKLDGGTQTAGTTISTSALGAHTLEFWSVDVSGNIETHHNIGFTVTAPRVTVSRLSVGTNVWATAVAAAGRQFSHTPTATPNYTGVKDIVLASGDVRAQADPLAAAGLCWAYQGPAGNAPLLLVSATASTDAYVLALIDAVAAANSTSTITIHIVGGPGSVPDVRYTEIANYVAAHSAGTVAKDRLLLTGDRYAMGAAIVSRMKQRADANPVDAIVLPREVFVANGADATKFFDPLALAPISAHRGSPILLVSATLVPGATKSILATLRSANPSTTVYVGGGVNTVSEAVRTQLLGTRISGPDRYQNATAIANYAIAHGWLVDDGKVAIAATIRDAQIGGSLAGGFSGPLLLTPPTTLNAFTSAWLSAKKATLTEVWVTGPTTALSDTVKAAINTVVQ